MKKLLRAGWLVMAAALIAGLAACTSDESGSEEPTPQQPANPAVTADGKVHVTVGAGIGDDGQTRSAVVETEYYDEDDNEKTRRTLTFTLPVGNEGDANYSPGDRLYICGDITPNERRMCGMLTIKSVSEDGKSATFGGDLTVKVKDGDTWKNDDTGWAAEQTGDPMTWYGTNGIKSMLIHAATADNAPIYIFYDDGGFRFNYNYSLVSGDGDLANKLMESAIYVSGSYDKSEGRFNLGCSDAIFNCTISGLDKNTSYYVRNSPANDMYNIPYEQTVKTDGDGTARFAISSNLISGNYEKFLLLSPDDNFSSENPNLLSCSLGDRAFSAKVYNLSRYWDGEAFQKPVDLSKLENDYVAKNGVMLTGTLDGTKQKVKIEIAAGATVTLHNAHINGQHYNGDTECLWAGITCLGDANIVLSGENTVTNFNSYYPAIFVPAGHTLTIGGTGSLTASNTYYDDTGSGAAIGGGDQIACGNIVITGGTVTAKGGYGSAAIGAGEGADCGSITISGPCTVNATGGENGAGIGTGNGAMCGDITISGTASVTATGGENGAGIGTGNGAMCGDITISGTASVTATGGIWAAGIGCGSGHNDGKSVCGAITIKTIEGQEDDFPSVTAIRGWGYQIRPIGHSYNDRNYNTCGIIMFGAFVVYDGGYDIECYNTSYFDGLNFSEMTTIPTGENNDNHGYDSNTWVLTK